MKLRTLLTVASIYMAVVGLGLMLFPGAFGRGAIPTDPSRELIMFLRLWGGPLLGVAVLDWLARDLGPGRAMDAIIIGNAVGFAAIGLMDVWGSFGGGRPVTKVFMVLHLLFALAFVWIGRRNHRGPIEGHSR